MQEEKDKKDESQKLPLDARILADSVIEFNISRRSVGLYPPGHAIITGSIDKSFALLEKLFEIRSSIILGIAKDNLVIDDNVLDKKNPVFREFALSLHKRGIAAITFISGAEKSELIKLHEILTSKDEPFGKQFVEKAEKAGIIHIKLSPIDFGGFGFVEGATAAEGDVWQDYIYALLEGKLSVEETFSIADSLPPEKMAEYINNAMKDESSVKSESYDSIITSYLRKKGDIKFSQRSLDKLVSLLNGLNPNIKQQLLSRSFDRISESPEELENVLGSMDPDSFQRLAKLFTEHTSLIPESLKNLLDKLSSIKPGATFGFDLMYATGSVVHDIEIDDSLKVLFDEDHFKSYVSPDYQKELSMMLQSKDTVKDRITLERLRLECKEDVVDRFASETMIEVLDTDIITRDDYLKILTGLSELSLEFLETGRFEDALNIYNSIFSQTLIGKFKMESKSTIDYYFQSEDFLTDLIESIRIWGRQDREGSVRLARVLKASAVPRLIDALTTEENASMRKFLLSTLTEIGSDVAEEAVRRLKDESRWFVIRNMLMLIRECGTPKYANYVRKFAKHEDFRISSEAVKSLLQFRTPDSVPFLKTLLQSTDVDVREQAVRLCGTYKVRDTATMLLDVLVKKSTPHQTKLSAVKSLGVIGDERAVKHLRDIMETKGVLFKAGVDELKMEILRNLSSYSDSSARQLIETGRNSKNDKIKSLSEQLMKDIAAKRLKKEQPTERQKEQTDER